MKLHPYQEDAVEFGLDRFDSGHLGAGYWADCGTGKTAITLHILDYLFTTSAKRVLLVAPNLVARTVWRQEAEAWGFDFDFELLHGGTPFGRERRLSRKHQIYVTTPGLLQWLTSIRPKSFWRFDTLVVDEATMFKNFSSQCSKAMRRILKPVERRITLTGTPHGNGYEGLHSQIYILDDGAALGKTKSYFNSQYMRPGYFKPEFEPACKPKLERAIAGMIYRIDAADHLDMPELVTRDHWVNLPPKIMAEYKRLEKELAAALKNKTDLRKFSRALSNEEDIVATSAGALYVMCKSLASGGVYEKTFEGRETWHVHGAKVDALRSIKRETPILVFYQYNLDYERLSEAYPDAPKFNSSATRSEKILYQWNASKIPLLFAQPKSMSHGLNMQAGTCKDVVWFGLTDSLERYKQAIARVYRQGQKAKRITNHRILARNTIDEVVVERIDEHNSSEQELLQSIKRYLK